MLNRNTTIDNPQLVKHMQNYGSYLVRHWLFAKETSQERDENREQSQAFDIEHVQTGRRTRVSTLNEAQKWIEAVTLGSDAMSNQPN